MWIEEIVCHSDWLSCVKSCLDLISICQTPSLDNGEDVAQLNEESSISTVCPALHSVPDEGHPAGLSSEEQPQCTDISGESGPTRKRKREDADDSDLELLLSGRCCQKL